MASATVRAPGVLLEPTAFGFDLMKIVGLDEDIQNISVHHDVYPTIDPAPFFAAQTFKGKVVLITGASRGLGVEFVSQYARAGASLALVARNEKLLVGIKENIQKEVSGVQVLTFALDVKDNAQVQAAVKKTVDTYGKLDIVVANAGAMRAFGKRLAETEPADWWNTVEVNIRGTFNFIHASIPHLQSSRGSIVALGSSGGHLRAPTGSDYGISKLAIDRLVEFITIEYPDLKVFTVHPGNVATDMALESGAPVDFNDKPALSAATILYLTAGKADWLSGRFISALWDLGELERDYKDTIVSQNKLVNKFSIP